ncbi:3-oxoadipate enol-lactonase [Nocardia sp. NPDC059246]|uniref:3-oxoadipate enol-lactonase n=1 Tax=unclassified Nocardia TaxID=2637762 RepID=UPI0036AB12D5
MSELFDPIVATGPVAAATGDVAWLQAMLDAEAALAWAQADVGVITAAQAEAIAAACRAELYDVGEIGLAATGVGNPAAALVRALTASVTDVDAAGEVHRGATSQDILDTAAMLVAGRAIDALFEDLTAATDLLAALAEQHACTPQVGRGLLQHALPVTFGLTAAGWLSALDSAAVRLTDVRNHGLAAQLGGAAGTLASLGDDGAAVLTAFARRLGLAAPEIPWHTDRGRIADLAGALGSLTGAVAKISRDITLLSQNEIGEVVEQADGVGGSSTLPHKRNPIAAVAAAAAAAQTPGLVANLLAAAVHEHYRAAGSWHAEWLPFGQLLRSAGTAVHWLRISLCRLQIHPNRMRRNLVDTGGLLLAERVTTALLPAVGRLVAHDHVTGCARRAIETGAAFIDLLAGDPVIGAHLDRARLEALLEPSGYLGSTRIFVRRAILAYRTRSMSSAARRDDGAVHVQGDVHGDEHGAPVLLMNALGSDRTIWDAYVEPLADKGFRVIRHDMRGHGDSPVPAGPYALSDLGGDVVALMDRLGVDTAHVVGISLGGMTGLWLAANHPDRVRGVVACCTSAKPGNAQMWRDRAARARGEGMARIADESVTRWFTPEWRATNPEITRHMRNLTADTPAEGYAACCSVLAELDLTEDLARIAAPTLVISTAEDPAFATDHGRRIAAGVPGARFELISEAGHLGTIEQPDRFLRSIIEQLSRDDR